MRLDVECCYAESCIYYFYAKDTAEGCVFIMLSVVMLGVMAPAKVVEK
jgi:hypothetical protein